MGTYKKNHSFEERVQESHTILQKYPDKLPVIIERATGKTEVPPIDKKKFLLPTQLTISQLIFIIRKRLVLSSDKALFLFVNNSIPTATSYISEVYQQHADRDGFLYMTYCGESTFGALTSPL